MHKKHENTPYRVRELFAKPGLSHDNGSRPLKLVKMLFHIYMKCELKGI